MHYDEVVASPKQKRLCCPKCKSNHLQAVVETATSARTIGNGYSPAKGCNGNRLRLPSPHREISFERRSRSLSESTGASDVPLCSPFAEEQDIEI